jgi:hypothetical protein
MVELIPSIGENMQRQLTMIDYRNKKFPHQLSIVVPTRWVGICKP